MPDTQIIIIRQTRYTILFYPKHWFQYGLLYC